MFRHAQRGPTRLASELNLALFKVGKSEWSGIEARHEVREMT